MKHFRYFQLISILWNHWSKKNDYFLPNLNLMMDFCTWLKMALWIIFLVKTICCVRLSPTLYQTWYQIWNLLKKVLFGAPTVSTKSISNREFSKRFTKMRTRLRFYHFTVCYRWGRLTGWPTSRPLKDSNSSNL